MELVKSPLIVPIIFVSGSENNSLYIYYKGLSKHLLTFKFDTVRSVLERERREEDANEFVSAVCWRPVSLLRNSSYIDLCYQLLFLWEKSILLN